MTQHTITCDRMAISDLIVTASRLEAEAEEFEGPDGTMMAADLDYWHPFIEALGVARKAALAAAPQPEPVNRTVPSDDVLTAVYDAFGIGALARDSTTLMMNLSNVIRRARCLSVIESVLTVKTPPDPDEGDNEPGEECLLNWGTDPDGYAEHFKAALSEWQRQGVQPAASPEPVGYITPEPLKYDGTKADIYVTGWNDCVAALAQQPSAQAVAAVTFVHELAMGGYKPEEIEARAKAIARMAPLDVQPSVQDREDAEIGAAEATLLAKTLDELGDCGETTTDHRTLLRWAFLGLLECSHFVETDKGRAVAARAAKGE